MGTLSMSNLHNLTPTVHIGSRVDPKEKHPTLYHPYTPKEEVLKSCEICKYHWNESVESLEICTSWIIDHESLKYSMNIM